jgi:methylthioribose-1-phosphate isomerase
MNIKPVEWKDGCLLLIDQRLLPQEEKTIICTSYQAVIDAIICMAVRGAPAIGISGAYAAVLAAIACSNQVGDNFYIALRQACGEIEHARPTAVNLKHSMDLVRSLIDSHQALQTPIVQVIQAIEKTAIQLHTEDAENNVRMANVGLAYIAATRDRPVTVMTHCNTGALATAALGTALGVIKLLNAHHQLKEVIVNETRPWMQGNRLTVWEMEKEQVPYRLICDSAAAFVMHKMGVQWLIVGADRITANGDVANKIGTYSLAIAAKYHGVKVMVVAPKTTWDLTMESGEMIPIETRATSELVQWREASFGLLDAKGYNPVFDVTPHQLIDVLVCEDGYVENPTKEKIAEFFNL